MSLIFDINGITIEELNETQKMILISFSFFHKEKNISWKFDKAYEILLSSIKNLSSKIPDIPPIPSFSYSEQDTNFELFKQNLKQYFSELLQRKEVYNYLSFQRLLEFPDSITTKIITIDSLSNITENTILDFYYIDPFLFISTGNINSSRALSFLFSYFEPKGNLIIYQISNSFGSYGEKKMIEKSKKDFDKLITKIKKIKNYIFCGNSYGGIEVFKVNKNDFYIDSSIENDDNLVKIKDIFYNEKKGLVYIFGENEKKVSIYEINYKKHIKDIELIDNSIIFSFISFDMNRIFIIDSVGTFWVFELKNEDNTVNLLQARYTKLSNISCNHIFHEKNNLQTLNIFISKDNKVYLYQYSNDNNNFELKLTIDVKFKVNSMIYIQIYKCLLIGCINGTIQVWKDTSIMPEYIIDSGYEKINKIFFDDNYKYIFVCDDKNLKILEINLDSVINKENDKNNDNNCINIFESLKDEGDKAIANNILKFSKSFQTPFCSDKREKKINQIEIKEEINDINIINDKSKESEIKTNLNENTIDNFDNDNEYQYEIRSIGSLDGWSEW